MEMFSDTVIVPLRRKLSVAEDYDVVVAFASAEDSWTRSTPFLNKEMRILLLSRIESEIRRGLVSDENI